MKTLNLNSKVLIIPISQLPEEVSKSIIQQDGPQDYNDVELFVYASQNPEMHACSCGCECDDECDDDCECGCKDDDCCCEGECDDDCKCGCKDDDCGCEGECDDDCKCGCKDDDCCCEGECDDDCKCGCKDDDCGCEGESPAETIRVVNEPVVILNTEDAEKIGFVVTEDMLFNISESGLTLVPGSDVGKPGCQTNAITITVD